MLRLTLIVRTDGVALTRETLGDVCSALTLAVALFVSGIQLITKPSVCGSTRRRETRAQAHSVIRGIRDAFSPLVEAAGAAPADTCDADMSDALASVRRASASSVLYHAGMVMKLCTSVTKLPTTDLMAVKRAVMGIARTSRSSVSDLGEELGLDTTSLGDATPLDAATLGEPLQSAKAGAGGAGREVEEGEGEDEGEGEEEASATSSVSAAHAPLLQRVAVLAIKAAYNQARGAVSLIDAVAAATVSSACASASSVAPAERDADVTRTAVVRTLLDNVASAAKQVDDAIIDLASAASDGDVAEAMCNVVEPMEEAVRALTSSCRALLPYAPAATSHVDATAAGEARALAVMSMFRAAVEAPVPPAAAAGTGSA
ncbi:hypothetical protein EON62_01320 [archaeon]|nr:MAG: hypothetical protein EON62_01320 [archaeon]